jgi:hypothetical protein
MTPGTNHHMTIKATTQRISPLHRWLAGLLVLVLLGFQAATASAVLHQAVHEDASQSDHQCAITLFAHGLVDAAAVDSQLQPPAAVETTVDFVATLSAPVPAHLLPPGRAPPIIPAR